MNENQQDLELIHKSETLVCPKIFFDISQTLREVSYSDNVQTEQSEQLAFRKFFKWDIFHIKKALNPVFQMFWSDNYCFQDVHLAIVVMFSFLKSRSDDFRCISAPCSRTVNSQCCVSFHEQSRPTFYIFYLLEPDRLLPVEGSLSSKSTKNFLNLQSHHISWTGTPTDVYNL